MEPQAELLEEYHAALQSYFFEGTAFWNRITAFVLLNSALLVARGALPAGPSDRWVKAGIGVLGIVAALLWAHTAIRAHYILAFWVAMLHDLERRLNMQHDGPYIARDRFLDGGPVRLPHGSMLRLPWYARVNVNDSTSGTLSVVFGAVWIVSLIKLF